MDQEKLTRTAKKAALAAGEILSGYFRGDLEFELKGELSPLVSQADREAELAMRDIIRTAFPAHGIIGEEFGVDFPVQDKNKGVRVTWVLDPLDGTSAFSAGLPTFVVLIAVWQGEEPLLGVIHQPLTGDMWIWAANGKTRLNGRACRSADDCDVPLILATTSKDFLRGRVRRCFEALQKKAVVTVYGGDGYLYASVASGRIGIVIEEGLKWHDVAALVPIVNGSGGVMTDLEGKVIKPGLESYAVLACASPSLHALALDALGIAP